MILNPVLYFSNRTGIPRIATSAVSVSTTGVTFTIPSDGRFSNFFNGLILLKMEQEIPDGTTGTLPIFLTSNAGAKPITVLGGEAWTVADYLTGIHLAYYESNTGTLQLLV